MDNKIKDCPEWVRKFKRKPTNVATPTIEKTKDDEKENDDFIPDVISPDDPYFLYNAPGLKFYFLMLFKYISSLC